MHYIYHIPEQQKIGCTINPHKRVRIQRKWKGHYEVLEQYEDPQIAGDREWELQDQHGYERDRNHYTTILANASRGGFPDPGSGGRSRRSLTMEDAIKIRQLKVNGHSYRAIAKEYSISHGSIINIVKGRTYRT